MKKSKPILIWKDPKGWSQKMASNKMMFFVIAFQIAVVTLYIISMKFCFMHPKILSNLNEGIIALLNSVFISFLSLLMLSSLLLIMFMYALNRMIIQEKTKDKT